MTATCEKGLYRQLKPMSPRLDVKPLALKISQLMIGRCDDKMLKWKDDNSVQLIISEIVPDNCVLQTLTARRKRFRAELNKILERTVWQQERPNHYIKQ